MAQGSRKLSRKYFYFLYSIPLFGIGGIAALDNKLTVLAIVLFALMALCFMAAIAFGVLFVSRANTEVDQIMRDGLTRQERQRRNRQHRSAD